MTLLVPFDGSALAEAALGRAAEFGEAFEEPVLAVTVIPEGNVEYAEEHGWLDDDGSFEMQRILAQLREQVADIAPDAAFRHITVDRYAPSGTISGRIRNAAREVGASIVFVGSENAGHMVVDLSSVGGTVAADEAYDVFIVRHRQSPDGDTLGSSSR